ncbi:nucleotide exchange factor sil1 [Dispira parvispora]|uniref:Nucleotide exchange factor SIL1 n=1 Tax=Dispira parvispora TaxID=1520584 RepID=A0A9W8E2H8_9FUNG|nr:nucleotide exchange factor sil1 [Dispira parvispora]
MARYSALPSAPQASRHRSSFNPRTIVWALVGLGALWFIGSSLLTYWDSNRPTTERKPLPVMQPSAVIEDHSSPVVLPDKDKICTTVGGVEKCYPRLFQATHQFREILPGQEIPKGLHVKVDMETGKKLAKLMDNTDKDDSKTNAVVMVKDRLTEKLQANPQPATNQGPTINQGKFTKTKLRVSSQAYEEFDTLFQQIAQDAQVVGSAQASPELTKDLLARLDRMSEIISEIDFGELFADGGGFPKFLQLIDQAQSAEVTKSALLVIGSALQNNPKAQQVANGQGVLDKLFAGLKSTDQPAPLLHRYIYALSCLVRGNRDATEQFMNHSGVHHLALLFETTTNADIKRRSATLISNIFNPHLVTNPAVIDPSVVRHDIQHWCWNFGSSLVDAMKDQTALDADWKNTLTQGLVNIHQTFPVACALTCEKDLADKATSCPFPPLPDLIRQEIQRYHEDLDYSDYVSSLKNLLTVM